MRLMKFLYVRSVVCLGLLFATDTLASGCELGTTSCSSGLSPYRNRPCRAHSEGEKSKGFSPFLFLNAFAAAEFPSIFLRNSFD